MNAPTRPAAVQAQALLDDIARQADARERGLREGAARDAAAIRARAMAKARRQLRRAIDALRGVEARRLQQLRAELETRNRRQLAERAAEALAAAAPRLGRALQRRWDDAAARAAWIDTLLAHAQARLARTGWVVRHPPTLPDAERHALAARLQALGVADVRLEADAALRAGLVIDAGDARLDASPAALLADRARVEAALLAELERERPPGDAAPAAARQGTAR